MINTTGYSTFGHANPLTTDDVDPVAQCVGATYFTKTGIPGSNMELNACPKFMAARCAKNWDDYCTAYLFD